MAWAKKDDPVHHLPHAGILAHEGIHSIPGHALRGQGWPRHHQRLDLHGPPTPDGRNQSLQHTRPSFVVGRNHWRCGNIRDLRPSTLPLLGVGHGGVCHPLRPYFLFAAHRSRGKIL